MKHDNIHETPDVSYIHNEGVAHEASDVNVKAIALFTGGLLFFVLVTLLLMSLFKSVLEKQAASRPEDRTHPMALKEDQQRKENIGPRLQDAPGYSVTTTDGTVVNLELREPAAESKIIHEDWQRILTDGQKDATGKQTFVPIEEAKKQLLAGGTLKSSADAAANAYEQAEEMPSASSAGRLNEKRYQ